MSRVFEGVPGKLVALSRRDPAGLLLLFLLFGFVFEHARPPEKARSKRQHKVTMSGHCMLLRGLLLRHELLLNQTNQTAMVPYQQLSNLASINCILILFIRTYHDLSVVP